MNNNSKCFTIFLFLLLYISSFSKPLIANDILSIGGNIWGEDDGNCILENELGGYRVKVDLIDISGNIIATTISDSNSYYEFKNLPEGLYKISLSTSNFVAGGPLYGLISCGCNASDNDVNNDDNGNGPFLGPIQSDFIQLSIGSEPNENGNSNYTIDFCFETDCGIPNPLAVHSCEGISDTICDVNILNLLCSKLSNYAINKVKPESICGNQDTIKNMDWFSFIAGHGNYSLDIDYFGCTGGLNAGQVVVYQMDDCEFNNAQEIFCSGDTCVTGLISISSSFLLPGNVYYLMLNGCGGSNCRYTIDIDGNFIQYQVPDPTALTCASQNGNCDSLSINESITITPVIEVEIEDDIFYTWTIVKPDGITEIISTTDIPFVYSNLDQVGIYNIEFSDINAKCSATPISPFAIEVEVINTINSIPHADDKSFISYNHATSEIVFSEIDLSKYHLLIFNALGETVQETNRISTNRLSIFELNNGFYFIQLRDKSNRVIDSLKIVK